MAVTSAGLLLHRGAGADTEVLIAHMGGPFWGSKDAAAWSIPKGEYVVAEEAPVDAALREFREELGLEPPPPPYTELGTWRYSSGKRITVFAADGEGFVAEGFTFGVFELEWPPRSGRIRRFPEVDRAEWTTIEVARERLVRAQRPALDALLRHRGG